jgi:hypothetical protein
VTVEVTVRRLPVLLDAAVRAFDGSVAVDLGLGEVDTGDMGVDEAADSREQIGADPAAALGWLLDPTEEIWPLLAAGSAMVVGADIDTVELSTGRYRLSWTVAILLRDVAAFRRVASDACPAGDTAACAEIGQSLAAAWQWAAPPFAPMQRIPGIIWSPVDAVVAHVPARAGRALAGATGDSGARGWYCLGGRGRWRIVPW